MFFIVKCVEINELNWNGNSRFSIMLTRSFNLILVRIICIMFGEELKILNISLTLILDQVMRDKRRYGYGNVCFEKLKILPTDTSLNLEIRRRLSLCCVWLSWLYGLEVITYTIKAINFVEAWKIWICRRC